MKNLSEIKIAVSGKSGCGNSTVSRLLAEKLGLKLINYTFHNMAEEAGIPFEEFCRRAENDPSFDYALDDKQLRLAQNGGVVLGSRLAVWLLKDADLKVYLYAPAEIRSGRIHSREGGRRKSAPAGFTAEKAVVPEKKPQKPKRATRGIRLVIAVFTISTITITVSAILSSILRKKIPTKSFRKSSRPFTKCLKSVIMIKGAINDRICNSFG